MNLFLTARLIVFAFVLFLPAQDPPGQPDFCANHGTDPVHMCQCHQSCDPLDPDKVAGDDPMCKTFCTKEHCHCTITCPNT